MRGSSRLTSWPLWWRHEWTYKWISLLEIITECSVGSAVFLNSTSHKHLRKERRGFHTKWGLLSFITLYYIIFHTTQLWYEGYGHPRTTHNRSQAEQKIRKGTKQSSKGPLFPPKVKTIEVIFLFADQHYKTFYGHLHLTNTSHTLFNNAWS